MSRKMKLTTRMLSVFLSIVLLFEVVPMQAFAAEQPTDNSGIQQEEVLTDETPEENTESEAEPAEFLSEDTEKREENVKHFRMSDGTMQAAQYAEPVHFLKDGVWTDYDNTLTEVDADAEENEGRTLLKNKDLTNQTADYSVRLSKKTNGKKFVRIEKDGYKLSWYYVGANKSTAKIAKQSDDNDPTTLEKLTSTVLYKDVFKATNFEYIIGSTGLKENFILESAKAPKEFTAEYKANGLTPVQIDEKTIELRTENGTVIYTVSAPFMTDADGACSDGITLSLLDVKNNTFSVKITLGGTWLEAEDRSYPVTVDPALKTEQSVSNAQTAFVSAANPNKCYLAAGTDDMGSLYVGNISGFGRTETYIKFTKLPDIGIGSKVVDARLLLGLRKCEVGLQVNVKRLVNDWDENTVTWNNGPYGEGIISDYLNFTPQTDVTHHQETEITDMVREWYSGDYPNYGLSLTTDKTAAAKAWFFSIHYTTYYQNRPLMVISYRNMSGYEDYWSYTNVSAGRGGVASVNNFTGNLVFSQAITQGDGGNLMPVNLSLIYNANQEKRLAGEWKPYIKHSLVGCRMQTNFHMYLTAESGKLAEDGYKYYLNDADGTKHWFWFEKDKPNEGKDEDGLGYKLNVITVGSDANDKAAKFVIADKEENKMYFNEVGNLTQIRNAAGISAKVGYETVGGKTRIKTITDGAGRVYTFLYNWENEFEMVTGIKDPAGRVTTIAYTGAYTVNFIEFADQKKISLIHTKDNKDDYFLTEIKGIDGTRTKINYDSSAQKRVSQINWGTSDTNLLEKYNFAYKQNSTKVTDIQNRSYTYQFNDWGQTTGVVSDTDGSAQFFKLHEGNSTDSRANKLIQESRVLQTVTNYVVNPGFTRAYSDGYANYIENTENQSISIDSSKKNLTNNALKIYKAASNTGRVNAVQYVDGLGAGTYTFSSHINTNGATLTGDAWILAEVWTTGGQYVSSNWAEHTAKTDGWERKSVTFYVPSGCQVRLIVGFSAGGSGTVWYDDLQLEKGEGTSTFNLVENSGFTNGTAQWSSSATKTSSGGLSGLPNCGYTNGDPTDRWRGISQQMTVAGKANDVYSFGAWVKAASVPIDNGTKADQANKPAFNLTLHYYDANGLWKGCKSVPINADLKNQWQFISGEYIIPNDYYKIGIELIYFNNVNTVSIAGAFCYKEQYGQTYDYDKNGNVISTVDLAKTNSAFSYYGNQMSRMLNPSGSAYMYTYDEKKQLTYALSTDGQQYGFTYDDKGNVTKAEITARKPATTIESGKEYILINAYSGLALCSGYKRSSGALIGTYRYVPTSAEEHWKLTLVPGTTDVYTLLAMQYTEQNYHLDVKGGVTTDGTPLELFKYNGGNAQKFKIVKEKDNTFSLFTACSNYEKLVDGQRHGNEVKQSQTVYQSNPYPNKDEPCYGQRWYFYPVENSSNKTIVTETTYTDSKNFVKSTKDQRGNETTFSYNEQKGTLTSTTDALGRTTSYTYDPNNNSLLSVSSGGMTNSYAYENDRLKTITVNGGLRYAFEYDAFGRTTSTKVGNGTNFKTLSSLEYNNKGLLGKQTYGNGDYIDFTYDNLDRITEKKYNGDANNRAVYRYGNDGSLAQTIDFSTGTRTKFTYDLADRLVSQKEYTGTGNNGGTLRSSTDFTYADKTNYLTGVKHFSPLGTQNIGYTYGDINQGQMPDQIYKVSWNGQEKLNYVYDGLGRLKSKTTLVSGQIPEIPKLTAEYTYYDTDDNHTTSLLKSISLDRLIEFRYTYDALGNIQSMHTGALQTTYEYDALNQLTRVNDPVTKETHTYEYQNGNILFDHRYDYTEGELPATPVSSEQYFYEDSVWGDVLTGKGWVYYNNTSASRASAQSADAVGRELAPTAETDASYEYAKRLLGENIQAVDMSATKLSAKANSGISAYSANSNASGVLDSRVNIVSDDIGNPVNVDGLEYRWNGRQLQGIYADENNYIKYSYNTDGQRVKKEFYFADDGMYSTYEYFYNGEILAGQKVSKTENGETTEYTLAFMYDNNGDAFGFLYNGEPYYYIKNAQNDVVLITDADGGSVVMYMYDAWGRITKCYDGTGDGIGSINPITYRSYYYDMELEMYYLNSRYYVPALCRFLNADDTEILDEDQDSLIENNLFAYCLNNPVNMEDSDGEIASRIIGGIVGGATGAVLGILLANKLGLSGWKKGALIAAATIGGAALGAFLGPYVAKLAKMAGGAVKKAVIHVGKRAIPKTGTQIGRLGKLVKNTKPMIRGITKHGLERMTQRGITKNMAQNIVRSGYAIAQNGGKTLFFTKAGAVVLTKTGEVVTAYSAEYFDKAMQAIVKQFYG